MKRQATVVLRNGRLMAEIVRTEACQQCRACQFGQREQMYVELPEGAFAPGDAVELELSEKRFALASLIAYALPVALLFAGLGVAAALGLSEGWQAGSAVAGLAIGLAVIRILEPKLRRFRPAARACGGTAPPTKK